MMHEIILGVLAGAACVCVLVIIRILILRNSK